MHITGGCIYMFDGVGHPWHVVLIAEAPNIDIHGSAGLVRLWVVDYQSLELVRKPDDPVGPIIQRGSL